MAKHIKDILTEWFYRLPKGYAEVPYTKEEMDILHEVLEENELNGSVFVKEVDQLDQAFLTYQFEIATHHEQNSPIHR